MERFTGLFEVIESSSGLADLIKITNARGVRIDSNTAIIICRLYPIDEDNSIFYDRIKINLTPVLNMAYPYYK